jgi:hypothetical protein
VLLSLVVPGLGHLYIGRRTRAAIWFVGFVVITAVFWSRDDLGTDGAVALVAILSVLAAVDAVIMIRLGPGAR